LRTGSACGYLIESFVARAVIADDPERVCLLRD